MYMYMQVCWYEVTRVAVLIHNAKVEEGVQPRVLGLR